MVIWKVYLYFSSSIHYVSIICLSSVYGIDFFSLTPPSISLLLFDAEHIYRKNIAPWCSNNKDFNAHVQLAVG